jgi:hypothetical protein
MMRKSAAATAATGSEKGRIYLEMHQAVTP